MGTLYLVATPIGNLGDITIRAVRTLSDVPLIAAEDTRQTRKLLNHLEIKTHLISYYEHNELSRLDTVLEALSRGNVALVSDAGTPALNDPGYLLLQAALEAGHAVSPVPGPSAPLAALVVSGLPTDRFTYLGYLPRKKSERQKSLLEVKGLTHTLIYLEVPHRLNEALEDILEILGPRRIAVARELTKLHEEVFRGLVPDAIDHFQVNPPRGEITLVIAGAAFEIETWSRQQVEDVIQEQLSRGESPAKIARDLAAESNWPRRKVYDLVIQIQKRAS